MLEYKNSINLKTINRLKSIVQEKKGKCLSKEYININSKLKWQCELNHTWMASANTLVHGKSWCPTCAHITIGKKRTLKDGLEIVKKIALQRNGKCLSEKYIAAKVKLIFECEKKHIFKMTPDLLKQGSWCRKCTGVNNIYTMDDMHKVASKKGGKCLSTKFLGVKVKLKWQCGKGHIWHSAPENLLGKRDTWCPTCIGRNKTVFDLNEAAKKRGGRCLAKKYEGGNIKVEWECSEGHRWMAAPANILNNSSWCSKCHGFFKEEICRVTFEQIFEEKFIKIRPKWLKSSSNFVMELDGYCKKFNIAFEYHGEQHFEKNHWIKTDKELKKRFKDDELKELLCKKNGIILIVVTHKTDLIKLPYFIKRRLIEKKFDVSQFNFNKFIDFNKAYRHKPKIEEMREIAKKRGGLCLSEKYIDVHTKLKWQCKKGHVWNAVPDSVKNANHWCPKCAGNAKHELKDIKAFARKKGGECLSSEYKGVLEKLKWKCEKGHVWLTTANQVLNSKSWCPKCLGRDKTIHDLELFAKKRGGKCLSEKYEGAFKNIKWQCNKGHIWSAIPSNVLTKNSWCPFCSGHKGPTIEKIKAFAKERQGECLSDKYINSKTKLKWKCKKNHIWFAKAGVVINQKTWCPECAGRKKQNLVKEI